jgi:hypothetical protein
MNEYIYKFQFQFFCKKNLKIDLLNQFKTKLNINLKYRYMSFQKCI